MQKDEALENVREEGSTPANAAEINEDSVEGNMNYGNTPSIANYLHAWLAILLA
jgi:hypothetical protein